MVLKYSAKDLARSCSKASDGRANLSSGSRKIREHFPELPRHRIGISSLPTE